MESTQGGGGREQTLWLPNLLLLGFKPAAVERKHKVRVDASTFQGKPNAAAMEVIMHFLLARVLARKTLARVLTRDIWPIYERKQARAFKKAVGAALQDMVHQGQLPALCGRPGLLEKCCGAGFEAMLTAVGQLAMRR
jgi:hypothetical protein